MITDSTSRVCITKNTVEVSPFWGFELVAFAWGSAYLDKAPTRATNNHASTTGRTPFILDVNYRCLCPAPSHPSRRFQGRYTLLEACLVPQT
jgi:hypothetical protein